MDELGKNITRDIQTTIKRAVSQQMQQIKGNVNIDYIKQQIEGKADRMDMNEISHLKANKQDVEVCLGRLNSI